MKQILMMVITVVSVLAISQTQGWAFKGGEGQGRQLKQKSSQGMVFKKIQMIYKFKDELAIADEQFAKLKEMKVSFKKEMIMTQAEIESVGVDIKAAMYDDEINVDAVNQLIDKKYELKKEKAKKTVAAIAALKNILTDEQKDKLTTLIEERKSEYRLNRKKGEKREGYSKKDHHKMKGIK